MLNGTGRIEPPKKIRRGENVGQPFRFAVCAGENTVQTNIVRPVLRSIFGIFSRKLAEARKTWLTNAFKNGIIKRAYSAF